MRNSLFATSVAWIALAISVVASLSLLGWVMLRCQSGFDFTDEGFYLNVISEPWIYRQSTSQFGFVYHPLFRLVGGDIVLLRQANVFVVFVIACVLCFVVLRSVSNHRNNVGISQRIGVIGTALVAGAGSLSFFDLWLATPSYNSLTLQSLMLAAIGVLLAGPELSRTSLVGWILVGIGGGFAFLAKPPSAAMLGCLVAVYLAASKKLRLRGVSISVAVAILFLVVSALAIDGSLIDFVRRFFSGLNMSARLGAGNGLTDILRWDGIHLSREQKFNFGYLFIATFVSASLSFAANGLAQFGALLIAIVISGMVIATIAGGLSPKISYESFQPVQFFSVSFGITLAAVISPIRSYERLSRNTFALIFFFATLPYAYAFGTGNNYWSAAARAGLFWFLAGFVICAAFAEANTLWRQWIPAAAMALLVSTGVLYSAMESPYRQAQPLHRQTIAIEIIPGKSRLFLSDEAATYIRALQQLSIANDFRAGTPVLDLTGASPGSLYAMRARPLGFAWLFGGYPGSTDFLRAALDDETCEAIAVSWVLTEPSAPAKFSHEMLRQFGIDIATHYVNVGSISSTRSFSPQNFEHHLLKPVRSPEVSRLACENAKRMRARLPQ